MKNVDGKTQPARGKVGLERVTFDADALDDQSGYLRVQCADQQRQQAWLGLVVDRRLAQGQPVGGPCQVALAVNCRKDTKKVQIEARQAALVINLVHDSSCRLIACVIIAQALSITHSNDRRTMPWISE